MAIEFAGFSPKEAASFEAMRERIAKIPDSFLLAITTEDIIAGYAVGPIIPVRYITDDLFERTISNPTIGGYQSILSLAVAPAYRSAGVASQLLAALKQLAQQHQRQGITLTCREELISFYEKNGYQMEGVSTSAHAGETWYNMVLDCS
ncbi:GNAT family N-acetyltransferase [Enterococcus sp. DIV0876]|uniref:GNAT family N-acetyltransferase n=1 Tax=Enterococcus sp. DIV0876 TaxID=2774633 RepID=UPI003D2FA812